MLSTFFLAAICVSLGSNRISADEAIGCLFSAVCQFGELCVNDNLFGTCVQDKADTPVLIKDLSIDQKSLLTQFLRLLAQRGYSWKDDETQCAIKWLIESFKSSSHIQPPPCLSNFNEDLPEQGQKRVSESLAHAFQSYMPQDGTDEKEHLVEKYPRTKDSIFVGKQLSRLSNFIGQSNRPEFTVFEAENSASDREEPVIIIPDIEDIGDNAEEDLVLLPISIDDEDEDNDDVALPLIVEENAVNDEELDDENDESKIGYGPRIVPQLRTGAAIPIFGNRIGIIDNDGDSDDDNFDEGDMFTNVMADEQLARALTRDSLKNGVHLEIGQDEISNTKPIAAMVSSVKMADSNRKNDNSMAHEIQLIEKNFAYVKTEPSVDTASEASTFLDCAVSQLGEEHANTLVILDSWHGEIVFEVRGADGTSSASSIAREIESNADKIRANCNRHVVAVGIGRRAHLELRQQEAALAQTAEAHGSISRWSASHTAVVAILVVVSVSIAGTVVAFVLLRYASRNGTLKHALGSIQNKLHDWKTRHFYEDLCRESIATKARGPGGLTDVITTGSGGSHRATPPPSPPPWAEEPRPTDLDVSTAHVVLAYMEEHLKNRSRLEEEWNELCGYAPDRSDLSVAHLAENTAKNRDMNVVPYDHNRVKLCAEANAFKSDYINASYIVDTDPRRPAYVVTQMPVAETVPDFWQLVWEQKSTLIVYLSQPNEPKAVRYWPDEGLTLYHRWQVGLVSEHAWNEDFIVRSLVLKDTATGDSRTVTQFHFLAWSSDHVPKLCRSVLAFRRKANRSYRPHASPIIVQSTNGGGRSGAYILLDMTLNHIAKGAREVDISASLEHLRDQRPGLVKTKEQFEFVLIAIAEEIAAIVKSSRDGSGSSSPQ